MIKVRTCSPVFKGESNSSSWMFQSGIIKKKNAAEKIQPVLLQQSPST